MKNQFFHFAHREFQNTLNSQNYSLKLKGSIAFLKICSLSVLLTSQMFGQGHELKNKCSITLMKGSFDTKQYIKEFLKDTILVESNLRYSKKYVALKIPVNMISTITLYSKLKSGRGAVKGLLIGAGIGTILGAIVGKPKDQLKWFDLTRPQAILLFNIFGLPIGTVVGALDGSRKPTKFIIHGDVESYNNQLEQMKSLIIE